MLQQKARQIGPISRQISEKAALFPDIFARFGPL